MNVWTTKENNSVKYYVKYDGLTRKFDNYVDVKEYTDSVLANLSLKTLMSCETKRVG